jgi:hypothetical protein
LQYARGEIGRSPMGTAARTGTFAGRALSNRLKIEAKSDIGSPPLKLPSQGQLPRFRFRESPMDTARSGIIATSGGPIIWRTCVSRDQQLHRISPTRRITPYSRSRGEGTHRTRWMVKVACRGGMLTRSGADKAEYPGPRPRSSVIRRRGADMKDSHDKNDRNEKVGRPQGGRPRPRGNVIKARKGR